MTHPRFLAEKMRPVRLTESHRDLPKRAFGFGFMNGARIVGSLGMLPSTSCGRIAIRAERIRGQKAPENASELWIT